VISVFDMYKVGIGPSSSHTVGPMRAANMFVTRVASEGLLARTFGVRAEMFGSLGVTGHGHGTVKAVVLGLEGEQPDLVDPAAAEPRVEAVRTEKVLRLGGSRLIPFSMGDDLVLHRGHRLPFHTNGMRFTAGDTDGHALMSREYYSVGGGFVLDENEIERSDLVADDKQRPVRYPFSSGDELLQRTREAGLSISELMLANELTRRSEEEIRSGLLHIWSVMQECVNRGIRATGWMPTPPSWRKPRLRTEFAAILAQRRGTRPPRLTAVGRHRLRPSAAVVCDRPERDPRRTLAGDVAAAAARQRALAGGVAAPPVPRRLLAARFDLRELLRHHLSGARRQRLG
jgi:iron-sulfur-dependent L-serine dehydratase single chain form